MANTNAPFGFRPARHVSGLGHRLNAYLIASALAETIAVGDRVKWYSSGGIQKAGAADAILGVFAGWSLSTQGLGVANYSGSANATIPFNKVWTSGTTLATGQTAIAWVHDDPSETFIAQTSQTLAITAIGAFVDLVDASPNTLFGASRQTVGAVGGATFRVERIIEQSQRTVDSNNNTVGWGLSGAGQYAVVELKPVKHERAGATAGVAV